MNEEIKEIIEHIKTYPEKMYCLSEKEKMIMLDYITNLQQDLDKANDIIEKDRQFYKCRMDEYVDYKSRCEKANKIITDFMCTEEYCNVDPVAIAENYMEIQKALNGSDENE